MDDFQDDNVFKSVIDSSDPFAPSMREESNSFTNPLPQAQKSIDGNYSSSFYQQHEIMNESEIQSQSMFYSAYDSIDSMFPKEHGNSKVGNNSFFTDPCPIATPDFVPRSEYTRQTTSQMIDLHRIPAQTSDNLVGGYKPLSRMHKFDYQSFTKPTYCDRCKKLLIGMSNQGLKCIQCQMTVHPNCQHALVSEDQTCANSSLGVGKPLRFAESRSKDPIDSDWHKQMILENQLRVPDYSAFACMVCSLRFTLVRRRHHCRRCGACICSDCSAIKVCDKVLTQNQINGPVYHMKDTEPIRTCTSCTQVVDEAIARAVSKRLNKHKMMLENNQDRAAKPKIGANVWVEVQKAEQRNMAASHVKFDPPIEKADL